MKMQPSILKPSSSTTDNNSILTTNITSPDSDKLPSATISPAPTFAANISPNSTDVPGSTNLPHVTIWPDPNSVPVLQKPSKDDEESSNVYQFVNWWKIWWCPIFCELLCGLQMSVLLRLSQLPNRFGIPQSSDAYIVTLGCIVFANVQSFGRRSGGFGNPAVTFAAYVAGRIDWRLTVVYSIAECIGSCAGVVVVSFLHPPGTKVTKLCKLQSEQTVMKLIVGEILQSIVIALFGCAVWRPWRYDEFVPAPPKYPTPPNDPLLSIKFGMMVSGIAYSAGWIRGQGGGANPAMALATALEARCWHLLWLFWLGPVLGCSIGAALYRFVLVPIPRGRKKSFVFN